MTTLLFFFISLQKIINTLNLIFLKIAYKGYEEINILLI